MMISDYRLFLQMRISLTNEFPTKLEFFMFFFFFFLFQNIYTEGKRDATLTKLIVTFEMHVLIQTNWNKATPNWYLGLRILFLKIKSEQANTLFLYQKYFRNLMEWANVFCLFILQSTSLEVRAIFFFNHKIFIDWQMLQMFCKLFYALLKLKFNN